MLPELFSNRFSVHESNNANTLVIHMKHDLPTCKGYHRQQAKKLKLEKSVHIIYLLRHQKSLKKWYKHKDDNSKPDNNYN